MQKPIIIGITGHKEILEEKYIEYKEKVQDAIREIKTKHPHTEIIVLSGLADGADRIAVDAAIEEDCKLIAVLPMPFGDYLFDFTIQSAGNMHGYISKALRLIELPWQGEDQNRQDQYTALAKHIVKYSQIILALWDGYTMGTKGEAYSIIANSLYGDVEEKENKEFKPVIHIPVQCKNSFMEESKHTFKKHTFNKDTYQLDQDLLIDPRNNYKILYPNQLKSLKDTINFYNKKFREIDDYNKMQKKEASGLDRNVEISMEYMLPDFFEVDYFF